MNVLFVCTGNTCRSPMAAALLNKMALEKGLELSIESAGVLAVEGENASSEAIVAMSEYGIDLMGHHAQNVTQELIEKSDLILTMTQAHKMLFLEVAPEKVYTLGEFAGLDYDIEDPFGGDVEDYRRTAKQIEDALEKVLDRLQR